MKPSLTKYHDKISELFFSKKNKFLKLHYRLYKAVINMPFAKQEYKNFFIRAWKEKDFNTFIMSTFLIQHFDSTHILYKKCIYKFYLINISSQLNKVYYDENDYEFNLLFNKFKYLLFHYLNITNFEKHYNILIFTLISPLHWMNEIHLIDLKLWNMINTKWKEILLTYIYTK